MSCNYTSDVLIPFGDAYIRTLDTMHPCGLMKIYCACGRIVDLDKKEMGLKLSLKKDLECVSCRNARISKEIESLNEHFDGIDNGEEEPLY